MKLERHIFKPQEFRAIITEDKTPTFSGYAAVFDSLSEDLGGFRETINPGAFRDSVGVDDVRALFNHDPNYVLGRNRSGTLRLVEDEKGLRFDVEAPDVQWARDLAESVQRGDIDQCSFGFYCQDSAWRDQDGTPVRELRKCQLFDVSIVTYPAYPDTSADVRSRSEILADYQPAAQGSGSETVSAEIKRKKLDLKTKEVI